MRNHLIAEVTRIAEEDPRTVILTADLGYSVLDDFEKKFPGRCFNVGICEQNMTAVAAGLALEGDVVYTYSIGNFPVMRCLEQLRNSVCYHNANVKVIAVGGGFVYGQLGMSHHATEDIAITRALPNMRVFCPADPDESVKVVRYAHNINGPCYIRLARGGEKSIHSDITEYDVTRILELRKGSRAAIIATGPILSEAVAAADALQTQGVNVGVYNCMTLKPFDEKSLLEIAAHYPTIITVEEHNIIGGLGTVVAETLVMKHIVSMPQIIKLGLQDVYTSVVGSQNYLRKYYGLSAVDIIARVNGLQSP